MKNHLVIFIFFLLLCNFTTKANKVDTLEHPPKNTIYASISNLELGLGFAALYDPSEYSFAVNSRNFDHDANPMPSKWSLTDKFLAGTIGYRYQTPDDFLLFRIGLSSPEGAYMTFGMAF